MASLWDESFDNRNCNGAAEWKSWRESCARKPQKKIDEPFLYQRSCGCISLDGKLLTIEDITSFRLSVKELQSQSLSLFQSTDMKFHLDPFRMKAGRKQQGKWFACTSRLLQRDAIIALIILIWLIWLWKGNFLLFSLKISEQENVLYLLFWVVSSYFSSSFNSYVLLFPILMFWGVAKTFKCTNKKCFKTK